MDTDKLIELKVLGITRNEVQSGAYALLLETVNRDADQAGDTPPVARRIPIVVGIAEAQSIAINLEHIVPTRPLTHDLFTSIFHAYGIQLEYVTIHSFNEGVFASLMHLNDGTRELDLDARTSDAVAIALRTGAPIYTTPDIVAQTSYAASRDSDESTGYKPKIRKVKLEELPIDQLEQRMQRYVEREQYERAAQIQKIIARKTNQPEKDA